MALCSAKLRWMAIAHSTAATADPNDAMNPVAHGLDLNALVLPQAVAHDAFVLSQHLSHPAVAEAMSEGGRSRRCR